MAVRVTPRVGETIRDPGLLVTTSCANCGMVFAVPQWWDEQRRGDHKGWYCPNGHSLVYNGPSPAKREAERLRAELAQAKRDMDGTLDELNRTEKERRRILKRIEAGVCTECNRTFQNLAAHMDKKHGHGPTGSLVTLTEVTFVHKQSGQRHRDGARWLPVRCGASRIHSSKAAYQWKDVTCPECRAREFGN